MFITFLAHFESVVIGFAKFRIGRIVVSEFKKYGSYQVEMVACFYLVGCGA